MIRKIRKRRAAAADWNTKAEQARPGQVWTTRYATSHAVYGGPFKSYTAGPVRIIGDDCPVPEYRGDKRLGEMSLDRPMTPRWFSWHRVTTWTLSRFDVAPQVPPGSGADLLAVPSGQIVTVQHRDPDLKLRSVEIGRAGAVEDFNDGEGPGRYVGDTWVRLSEVSGVQW